MHNGMQLYIKYLLFSKQSFVSKMYFVRSGIWTVVKEL